MLQHQFNLYDWSLEALLQMVKDEFPNYTYDSKKHVAILNNEHHEALGFIRLPPHILMDDRLKVLDEEALVLYLTIESGNAALSVMQGLENDYHTTFSAYMTRKKQGFSQIKYLNKKGKSRAGSRVRLAATVEFFENINTTMEELLETYSPDRIALSCSKTLLPHLFQSKVPFPYDKRDPRLYKIPLHIPQSNFTNLNAVILKLQEPTLFYEQEHEESLSVLLD